MRSDLIEKAIQALPKNKQKQYGPFLEQFYAGVPDDDLAGLTPQDLTDIASDHYDLSQKYQAAKNKKPQIAFSVFSESTQAGFDVPRTVINVVCEDKPFVVDSVAAEINKHHQFITLFVHPVQRLDASDDTVSHLHIRLRNALDEAAQEEIKAGILHTLSDVDAATKDWHAMRDTIRKSQTGINRAPSVFSEQAIEEYIAFLDYLYQDNFTFLGVVHYTCKNEKGGVKITRNHKACFGLYAKDLTPPFTDGREDDYVRRILDKDHEPLHIFKLDQTSRVHRRVPPDCVVVRGYDDDGKLSDAWLFTGLLTSVTYSRSIRDIPLLRWKARHIIDRANFVERSHNSKSLRHILERYPRDEFLQSDEDRLFDTALDIVRLQERRRIALYIRPDILNRFATCMVYVPRDRYDTHLRLTMQRILEDALEGRCLNHKINLDDSLLARVLYTIDVRDKAGPLPDICGLERKLQDAGRSWAEKLGDELIETRVDTEQAGHWTRNYGEAFPIQYCRKHEASEAITDIEHIERCIAEDRITLEFYKAEGSVDSEINLKIYNRGAPVTLSDVLPILENMGVRVISEIPYEINPAHLQDKIWVHDFTMHYEREDAKSLAVGRKKQNFETAFVQTWYGHQEDDSINRLVLSAGLSWREVTVLRSYIRYMKQIRYPHSRRYVEQSLTDHPRIAKGLVDLFKARFNPETAKDSESYAAGAAVAIDYELEAVESLDQDRSLRVLMGLIEATLRTNYFVPDTDGQPKPYLSFKFDCSQIPELHDPKPYREMYVYSPQVEGIHLRGDKIARGGLRWSDRHEDFRVEILGLMKAQMVKNAVIVPMGAKGGFIVKNPPKEGGRQAYMDEGIACYKTFIRGLLDITDNRKGGDVIPPANVVRRDGDDPYLVVAADKGTARFSDIANGISKEYDFWLGDAFASGGSAGYDHKAMGITARGGWESVKRHFRELGHDTQSQDFTVVGCGDMSGDVFGNGMLLSEHIKLIGAFNHLHIFVDPDPDPKTSFLERQRLFDAVKGWDEYQENCLSKGGKIFNRNDKNLLLTPEIQNLFQLSRDRVTPLELIRAMLKSQVDLLWFGGIGTYIKAASESHADVDDKANDALRINAEDVRARVIGEGANLGVTQRARIIMAQNGVCLNADYIDNSGGVNSSDQEVNIKILLNEVMRDPKTTLTEKKRNMLLETMTDEVGQLVLKNNYQQAQAISLMSLVAPENLAVQGRFIADLEREHGLNRKLEALPDEDAIESRLRQGKGLTRPELALLQSYAKILFTKDLLASDIPNDPELENWLFAYFPKPLHKPYADEIRSHRLKAEIIATELSNYLVNRLGPVFVKSRMDKTGAACADVARAFIIVLRIFGLHDLWQAIEGLDGAVNAQVQLAAMRDIARMAEHDVSWFLTRLGEPPVIERDIKRFAKGVTYLIDNIQDLVTKPQAKAIEMRLKESVKAGLPETLARRIALTPVLNAACDIVRIAEECKAKIDLAARVYFELGVDFHLDWLRSQAALLPKDDVWDEEAIESLIDELYSAQAGLTRHVLTGHSKSTSPITDWVEAGGGKATRIRETLKDMKHKGTLDLPMLVIAEQRLRALYGS